MSPKSVDELEDAELVNVADIAELNIDEVVMVELLKEVG